MLIAIVREDLRPRGRTVSQGSLKKLNLTGAWMLVRGGTSVPARARVEGEELVIALSDGPEIRLKKDLSGFWRWGAKTSERPVQFEVTDEGKLKGRTVGPFRREDWILER